METTEAHVTDVQQSTADMLHTFEALMHPIHTVFVKLGGEKMFLAAESAADSTGGAARGRGGQLPSMFLTPAVTQAIKAGISTRNLTQVRVLECLRGCGLAVEGCCVRHPRDALGTVTAARLKPRLLLGLTPRRIPSPARCVSAATAASLVPRLLPRSSWA